MKKPHTEVPKNLIKKAFGLNILVGGFIEGLIALGSKISTPHSHMGTVLVNAIGIVGFMLVIAMFYAGYRIAYWSVSQGYFKPRKQGILTALMMILGQGFVGFLLGLYQMIKHGSLKDPSGHMISLVSVAMMLAFQAVSIVFVGLLVAICAENRAQMKLEAFDEDYTKVPRISPKIKYLALVYGLLSTIAAIGVSVTSVQDVIHHHYKSIISLIAWPIFVVVFWIAYSGKIVGKPKFWKLFAPLIIFLDMLGIAIESKYEAKEIVISAALSLPLYMMVYWYSRNYLPYFYSKQIKGMKSQDLFK